MEQKKNKIVFYLETTNQIHRYDYRIIDLNYIY